MASAVATEKIGSQLFIQSYDHDPGATTAILGSPDGGTTIRYLDMKDYTSVGVQVRPTIITTSLTRVELVASATTATPRQSATDIVPSGSLAPSSASTEHAPTPAQTGCCPSLARAHRAAASSDAHSRNSSCGRLAARRS